jgi:hypothetical protein
MSLRTLLSWVAVLGMVGAVTPSLADKAADEINAKIETFTTLRDDAWTSVGASIEFVDLKGDVRKALSDHKQTKTEEEIAAIVKKYEPIFKENIRQSLVLPQHYRVKSVTTVEKLIKGPEIKKHFDKLNFPVGDVPVYLVNFAPGYPANVVYVPSFVPPGGEQVFVTSENAQLRYRCKNYKKFYETLHRKFFGEEQVLLVAESLISETEPKEPNQANYGAGLVVRELRRMLDNSTPNSKLSTPEFMREEYTRLLSEATARATIELKKFQTSLPYTKTMKAIEEKLETDLKPDAIRRELDEAAKLNASHFTQVAVGRYMADHSEANSRATTEMLQFWKTSCGITVDQAVWVLRQSVPVIAVKIPEQVFKMKDGSEFRPYQDAFPLSFVDEYTRKLYSQLR